VDVAELSQRMMTAKREIDAAFDTYEKAILEDAEADRASKVAKASAYLAASGPVAERQASVDQTTADVQYRSRLAEGLKRSAGQAVESKRQWLSALQSLASLSKAEAALAKWEPSQVASA
jgi:hypothetical protein